MAQEQHQWAQAEQYYQKALQIKIEFKDGYAQASTYGLLGLLAKQRRQWPQAQQYLLQALEIFHDAGDEHSGGIALRSLAWRWQASGDATLPAAVAPILGTTVGEVEKQLRALP